MRLSTLEIGRAQLDSVTEIALNLYMPNLLRQRKAFTLDTRNTCIAKPREARGGGGGGGGGPKNVGDGRGRELE